MCVCVLFGYNRVAGFSRLGLGPIQLGMTKRFFSSLASALWESDDHGFCGETVWWCSQAALEKKNRKLFKNRNLPKRMNFLAFQYPRFCLTLILPEHRILPMLGRIKLGFHVCRKESGRLRGWKINIATVEQDHERQAQDTVPAVQFTESYCRQRVGPLGVGRLALYTQQVPMCLVLKIGRASSPVKRWQHPLYIYLIFRKWQGMIMPLMVNTSFARQKLKVH